MTEPKHWLYILETSALLSTFPLAPIGVIEIIKGAVLGA